MGRANVSGNRKTYNVFGTYQPSKRLLVFANIKSRHKMKNPNGSYLREANTKQKVAGQQMHMYRHTRIVL